MMNKVKTFEDALALYKGDKEGLQWFLGYKGNNPNIIASIAFLKLSIITQVLNGDWTPDFSDRNQDKYYPWFSTVGDNLLSKDSWHSYTYFGSSPCLKSEDLVKYCSKQFVELYEQLAVKPSHSQAAPEIGLKSESTEIQPHPLDLWTLKLQMKDTNSVLADYIEEVIDLRDRLTNLSIEVNTPKPYTVLGWLEKLPEPQRLMAVSKITKQ